MSNTRYAELASRRFQSSRQEAAPRLPANRRALVGAIAEALQSRRRRRAAVRWWAAGGVAAVAAAAVFVLAPRLEQLRNHVSSAPAGSSDARRFRLAATGAALDVGSVIAAPSGQELQIGTPQGTSLVLEPGSRLAVLESGATQRLALKGGAVRVHVAKLAGSERFIIETEDTEVEVHGTTFRVAFGAADPRCPGAPLTRVTVSEGVVSVASGSRVTRVAPGAEWPGRCPSAAAEPAAPPATDAPAAEEAAGDGPSLDMPAAADLRRRSRRPHVTVASGEAEATPAAARDDVSPQAPPAPSVLAAQNDLFAAAVRARRRGDAPEALRLFNAFIKTYPRSQLYEHALAQKMKLLGATDPWGASEAATEYLARFPGGFARAEARALLSEKAQP